MVKKSLRLFVKVRENKGAYTVSVPMKKLLKFSKSPDKSRRWSFEAGLFSGFEEIWVVNSDGSGLTQLTDNTAGDQYPCISGDGSKIAFNSDLGGDFEIWLISQDVDAIVRAVDYTPYLVGGGIIAAVIIGVVGYIVFRRRKNNNLEYMLSNLEKMPCAQI